MGSKVGLGDIRGLLVEADKRPVLRLLPQMDEVCRGYAIAHLGDAETIASQVWLLNTTDWMRKRTHIYFNLARDLDRSGFSSVMHKCSLKIVRNALCLTSKLDANFLKDSHELMESMKRWIDGEYSRSTYSNYREKYKNAYCRELRDMQNYDYSLLNMVYLGSSFNVTLSLVDANYWGYYNSSYPEESEKRNIHLLADMLEDSVGIERGVEEKSLESKVIEGGL